MQPHNVARSGRRGALVISSGRPATTGLRGRPLATKCPRMIIADAMRGSRTATAINLKLISRKGVASRQVEIQSRHFAHRQTRRTVPSGLDSVSDYSFRYFFANPEALGDVMREAAIAIAILVNSTTLVHATARDDALGGMARCGSIADDRNWLNCIYGAVQPMRSELGLPPASASQTSLVPVGSGPPPQNSGVNASATSEPKKSGGFFSYMLGGDAVLTNISLASYRFDSLGWFTVTLANGQVWEQRDGSQLAHWRGPVSQYVASIRKGAVGSYNLTIASEGKRYKVRRVQ